MTAAQNSGHDPDSRDDVSNLKILAIDTSTSMASAAIACGHRVLAEAVFSTDRTLSARLMPEIERLVALAGIEIDGIDLFAASLGPGSFTGVRGGLATIQGLALATGKPCVGYSSLALLAMNFSLSPYPVCPVLDARKSEVYAGLYDCSSSTPVPIIEDRVLPPADLLDLILSSTDQPVIFAGDGAQRYSDLMLERIAGRGMIAPFQLHVSHAANGAMLALEACLRGESVAPALLLPIYLRASEAEINRKKKM
ncbi:MAG: tRNA (adenosine(37)-N6)-threonylcarbamoyltransferase complex dimerization subunit type 1 TsaB [Geobacteraceae bacterium]|nr:tRNA (adenosine(37)-N6)-threonylcarbamoyltransferase complex dimerization subunit type 1 TsaB [Geobacteraceae bacterium]